MHRLAGRRRCSAATRAMAAASPTYRSATTAPWRAADSAAGPGTATCVTDAGSQNLTSASAGDGGAEPVRARLPGLLRMRVLHTVVELLDVRLVVDEEGSTSGDDDDAGDERDAAEDGTGESDAA